MSRWFQGAFATLVIITASFNPKSAFAQQSLNTGGAGSAAVAVGPHVPTDGANPTLHQRDWRYTLQPSDTLEITFMLTPDFNQTVTVQPDGYITLRDVGTNQTFTTVSNDMGFYVSPNLPTGTLAIDAFNLLNRPNVDQVFSVYDAPDFVGAIPRHYKDGVGSPVNPDFGAPRTMFNPRQLQLSARFSF